MIDPTILEKLKMAIANHSKIHFQMKDTAIDKVILFHPYAIVIDPFNSRMECFGYIEKHYNGEENYSKIPVIDSITMVNILDDKFLIIDDWIDELKRYSPPKEIIECVKP